MTKVEELRVPLMELVEGWVASIEGEWGVDLTHEKVDFERILDSLISAAHAEGKAEGAEQERGKILVAAVAERERIIVSAVYMKQIDSIMADCYIVPASVLAPTKESYAECLRDSVTDEINGEDVDPTPD